MALISHIQDPLEGLAMVLTVLIFLVSMLFFLQESEMNNFWTKLLNGNLNIYKEV